MILTRRHRYQTTALTALTAALSWMVMTPAPAHAPVRSTSIIVEGPRAAQHTVAQLGGRVTHDLPIIGGFSAKVPANDVSLISQLPGVRGVMPDLPTRVQSTPGTYNQLPDVFKKTTGGNAL